MVLRLAAIVAEISSGEATRDEICGCGDLESFPN
jgi:hypothetical protein